MFNITTVKLLNAHLSLLLELLGCNTRFRDLVGIPLITISLQRILDGRALQFVLQESISTIQSTGLLVNRKFTHNSLFTPQDGEKVVTILHFVICLNLKFHFR